MVAFPSDRGAEPVVALAPCAGHRGTPEPHQTLFTWAQFIAEQPQPTKRPGRKAPPVSQSLFEWALAQEQGAALPTSIAGQAVAAG